MLEVRDLSLTIRDACILQSVSFSVSRGEVLAIVGPNGAGKTSLLEAVVGLRKASSGAVRFAEKALRDLRSCADTFAYAPDEVAPYVELTVNDVLRGVAEALRRELGVDALDDARLGTLSRGERKRVALCTALSTTRPVAVLDEPLSAFDPLQLRDVVSVIRKRAREGLSIVITVHQLGDAEKIADRILLLSAGRAVALGTLDELRARFDLPGASLEAVFVRALGAQDASA